MQNTKRKFFLGLFLICALTSVSGLSYAQAQQDFEEEFKNFREKLQEAKNKSAAGAAGTEAPAEALTTPAATDAAAAPAAAPATGDAAAAALTAPAAASGDAAAAGDAGNSLMPAPIEGVSSPSITRPASPLGLAADLPLSPATAKAIPATQTPEQLQLMMEAEVAAQKEKIQQQTFDAALKNLLPLEPSQIRTTLQEFSKSREAAETPLTMPTPKQAVETVSLDPSDGPVVIRTSPGYVTTVILLDATGAPWPIQDFSWAGKFDVTPPEEGGHVLRITPLSAHGVGNISIRMVDLITPITMQLVTGLDEVYYRLDARIPKPGPLAKTPIIEYGGMQSVAGTDDNMVGVLDGTPPASAAKMKVKGVDGQTSAWRIEETVYLRTPLTLLSPGWNASVSSADGMNVYSLSNAPVVLLSDRGRMVRAQIVENEVTP